MVVLKNGVPQPNEWVRVADDAALPDGTKVIVSFERWQAERETLRQRNSAIGVSLKSDQSPLLLADDLDRISLVALEFPKFTDGRAFSYARVLRDRLGYLRRNPRFRPGPARPVSVHASRRDRHD